MNFALGKKILNPKILDVDCERGHISAEIQKKFPSAEISGLDYSISAIKYAVNKFPIIDFCVADANNLPYCKNYFDVIICNNLFEHIDSLILLIKSMKRSLNSGAFLIISTPSRYRFSNLLNVLRGKPVNFMSTNHVTEYSVGQVIELIKWSGMSVKKVYRPISPTIRISLKSLVAYLLILPITRIFLQIINSHHNLESTVFFLAQKVD